MKLSLWYWIKKLLTLLGFILETVEEVQEASSPPPEEESPSTQSSRAIDYMNKWSKRDD